VVTFAATPEDGEVHAQVDESPGEFSPALAALMAAATVGAAPAGPALRRAPILLTPSTKRYPEPQGYLCAQAAAFKPHAARRVAPNDRQGREMLCRSILRPPVANERVHHMEDGAVTLEFKRAWKDGTRRLGLGSPFQNPDPEMKTDRVERLQAIGISPGVNSSGALAAAKCHARTAGAGSG
jgi:hypothetical protein